MQNLCQILLLVRKIFCSLQVLTLTHSIYCHNHSYLPRGKAEENHNNQQSHKLPAMRADDGISLLKLEETARKHLPTNGVRCWYKSALRLIIAYITYYVIIKHTNDLTIYAHSPQALGELIKPSANELRLAGLQENSTRWIERLLDLLDHPRGHEPHPCPQLHETRESMHPPNMFA